MLKGKHGSVETRRKNKNTGGTPIMKSNAKMFNYKTKPGADNRLSNTHEFKNPKFSTMLSSKRNNPEDLGVTDKKMRAYMKFLNDIRNDKIKQLDALNF